MASIDINKNRLFFTHYLLISDHFSDFIGLQNVMVMKSSMYKGSSQIRLNLSFRIYRTSTSILSLRHYPLVCILTSTQLVNFNLSWAHIMWQWRIFFMTHKNVNSSSFRKLFRFKAFILFLYESILFYQYYFDAHNSVRPA